jgi:hypothetical protein
MDALLGGAWPPQLSRPLLLLPPSFRDVNPHLLLFLSFPNCFYIACAPKCTSTAPRSTTSTTGTGTSALNKFSVHVSLLAAPTPTSRTGCPPSAASPHTLAQHHVSNPCPPPPTRPRLEACTGGLAQSLSPRSLDQLCTAINRT